MSSFSYPSVEGVPAADSIVNSQVSPTAAIARSKLASGTAYRLIANSSAGVMTENAELTAARVVYTDANGQLATASTLAFDASTGRMGIGTGATATGFIQNGATQTSVLALGAEGGDDNSALAVHRHGDTAAIGGSIVQIRSRGTEASPTIVASGDILGRFNFAGYNGVDYSLGASIRAAVDGTPGDNDMPTRLSFWVTPDGSETLAEALRIAPTKVATFYGAVNLDTLTASRLPILNASKDLISTGIAIDGSNNVSGLANLTMTTGALSLTTGSVTLGNGAGSFASPRISIVNSSTSSGDIAAYGLLSTRTDVPRSSGMCWLTITSSSPAIGLAVTTSSTWASSKYALTIDSSTTALTFGEGTTQVHRWNGATQSTVGAAGGASALPATPVTYIEINVNGTARVIPCYLKS